MYNDDRLMPDYIRELQESKFSVKKPAPDIDFKLFKNNIVSESELGERIGVAARGELVMIYGPEKCRKSGLGKAILASAYTPDIYKNFGFHLDLDDDEWIVHYDTEMGKIRYYHRMRKFSRVCGYGRDEDVPMFTSTRMKGHPPHEMIEFMNRELGSILDRGERIGAVLFDQAADYVNDINDRAGQVNPFIKQLEKWQEWTNAIFIGVMHTTLESKRMTGVLGRELAKKMDSGLLCEVDPETKYTCCTNILSREEPFDDFCFAHNTMGYTELILPENVQF